MKSAVCIGINTYGGGSDLAGCVNDARDWGAVLAQRGFTTRTLLDRQATRAGIIKALKEAVAAGADGDLLVVTYSGHGTWVPDRNGDEPDRRDEAWCPADVRHAGVILDDELAAIFAKAKARVVILSDSCHSGTITRLYGGDESDTRRIRFLPPYLIGISMQAIDTAVRSFRPQARELGDVLLLSGCQDWEYSYDASFNGRANGAFTRVAINTLATLPRATTKYGDWFRAIRRTLPSRQYPQTPNVVGPVRQMQTTVFGG